MNNYSLPELIWAITMLMWPICILCLAILFKKEISSYIRSKCQPDKNEFEKSKLKNKTPNKKKDSITPKHEIEDTPIDICRNLRSKDYFIFLKDQNDKKAELIIPNGDIKVLELNFFEEIEEQNLHELYKNNLISEEQLSTYKKYLDDGLDKTIDDILKAPKIPLQEEPPYIGKYRKMLLNENTIPARMFEYIKENKKSSWLQIKNHLKDYYGYSDSDHGSYSASLRVLLIDGYIDIEGYGDNKVINLKN